MTPRRVLVVAGTRPEAVKLAPVLAALRSDADLDARLLVTGQHREICDQVLDAFGLRADDDLDILRPGQDLGALTALALERLGPAITRHAPGALVVQGDTTTAFVAALAAFYAKVPVVHVEAGLRSLDMARPFPEEANRRLVSTLASLHLAPTPLARRNLLAEGVPTKAIVVTGNTVVDALETFRRTPFDPDTPLLAEALDAASGRRLVAVTTHRRENWGRPQRDIARAVRRAARTFGDAVFIVPMHPNPVVRGTLRGFLSGLENVFLTEPLGYREMVEVLSRAWVVATDSGGIQEEGSVLGTPVLVLRDVTERPEGVHAGVMRLVGTEHRAVFTALATLLRDATVRAAMARPVAVYGDGRASDRTRRAVRRLFGLAEPPVEGFHPEQDEEKEEQAWAGS